VLPDPKALKDQRVLLVYKEYKALQVPQVFRALLAVLDHKAYKVFRAFKGCREQLVLLDLPDHKVQLALTALFQDHREPLVFKAQQE
jgi:hypothetical protein